MLVAALLLLAGVLLTKTSDRLGVPSLVLFLLLGVVAGSEGLVGIEFDDAGLAREVGVVALAFILFSGGLETPWPKVRPVLASGALLATVGVVATAAIVGAFATVVGGLDPLGGLLVGSVVAATDAAAVFSILGSRGVALRDRPAALLELESGSNDPMAVFLTVGAIGLIDGTAGGVAGLALAFVAQMGIGLVAGRLLARVALELLNRLRLDHDGLYPVLTVAFVLVTYETTEAIGGSGLLATYVAGLTLSASTFVHKGSLVRFHEGTSWLVQIAMFVVFGLLVFPSDVAPVAAEAVLVAASLILVARPVAVALVLAPFRVPWREVAFVSWVGLRGATPIVLATFPLAEGIDGAYDLFNIVFFVVVVSVVVQGTTITAAARLLGVTRDGDDPPDRPGAPGSSDAVDTGVVADIRRLRVAPGAPADGRAIVELGLPEGVLIVLVQRDGRARIPQGGTRLRSGDEVRVLAADHAGHDVARGILAAGDA